MAWLGEGFSSLKGQITSFTKEVLSDGKEDGSDVADTTVLQEKVRDLESYCASQDLEISELRERNQQLQFSLNGGKVQTSAVEVAESDALQYVPTTDSWSSWDQPGFQPQYGPAAFEELPSSPEKENLEGKDQYLKDQVGHLEAENNLMKRTCSELEDQVAELSEQLRTITSKDQNAKQLKIPDNDHQHVLKETQLQEQLQASELRVRDLESQLRDAQEELLGQLIDSQESASLIRSDLEQTRKTQLTPKFYPQVTEPLKVKQRTANKIREVSLMREVAASNLKELQSQGKGVSSDIVAIIQNLGNHEQQELIHGALDALELENQVLKLRNAELEMQAGSLKGYNLDLDVGYKVDHFGDESKLSPRSLSLGSSARSTSLDGQIDHLEKHERSENMNANWSAEKRILEKQCSELKARLRETENNLNLAMAHKGLLEVQKQTGDDDVSVSPNNAMEAVCMERDQLVTAKQCLTTELEALEVTVQDLEAKMTAVLEENSALSSNLEELDQQHQVVIEKLLETKKTVVKENETFVLELATLKKQLKEIPSTNSSIDNSTDTCDLTESNEVLYEEYKKTFDEEFSEKIMQLVTFDLPQGQSSCSNSEELKSTILLESLLKVCEESKWKKDTLERKVAEVMKEVRDTQKALTERDEMIPRLHRELAALKENEEVLIKEIMAAKESSGEGLASIPENSEEVEALEQRVALLEEQLQDKATLQNEIARLKEERAVIARKFHIAEASLDNEENFQICTGHELQQALQGNVELQRENSTLLSKVESLEVIENNHKEIHEKYLNLLELLAVIENELCDARKIKSLLEVDVETKSYSLQQALNANMELQEQNNANLINKIKSQEELINTSQQFEVECSRLQKLIIGKEEELHKALDGTYQLKSELTTFCVGYQEILQAKTELDAEHTSLVSQVKTQEEALKSNENLHEEVLSLQTQLNMKQMALDEAVSNKSVLETDLATLTERFEQSEEEKLCAATTARDMEELVKSKLELESEIVQWQEKYQVLRNLETSLRDEISELKNTSQNLGTQMEMGLLERETLVKQLSEKEIQCYNLLVCQSTTDEECISLKSQLAAKSAEVESVVEAMSLIKCQNEDLDASLASESESKRLEDQQLMTHEVDKWKEMVNATERQLNETLQARAELEAECRQLFTIETKVYDQECLQRETSRLTGVLETTQQRLTETLEANVQLEEACMLLKVQLDDTKGLEQEVSKWKEQCSHIEHELQNTVCSNQKLEEECQRLSSELTKMESAHSEAVQWKDMHEDLQRQFDDLSETKSILEAQLATMQKKLQGFHKTEDELNEWKEKVQLTECQLHEVLMKKLELEREFNNREEAFYNNEKMDQEKPHKDDKDVDESVDGDESNEVDALTSAEDTTRQGIKEQIDILQAERDRMLTILDEKTRENGSLKTENHRLMQILSADKVPTNKMHEEKVETRLKHDMHLSESSLMAKETIANLSEIIRTKDIENEGLSQKCTTLVKLLQDVEDSSSKQLSRLMVERDELIRTVQLKHQESLQYHGEIQRLSGLLNQELGRSEQIRLQFEDKQKMLLNTQNELIAVKQRLDKLEQAAGTGVKTDQAFVSRQSTNMEVSTENKEVEVMEPLGKQEYSQSLAEGMSSQNIAVTAQDSQEALIQKLKAEHTQLLDRTQQEAMRNIYLQNEVQEQHEKEGALMRELERLRLHLVAVEESYTQEAVTTENEIRDLQAKLSLAEDRIKSCSTALTSASVRANQHVESLQGQTRLIGQQRDDVQAKLSAAEDQIQRHVAALTNLQAVLEQFQRDKDQEETIAKARLQRQLQVAEDRQVEFLAEVASLKSQLSEAKDGLSAAARLGEQLDRKTQVIAELKEEVTRLQGILKTAEKREESASLNAEGKVDRYLVKNLLLGYLSAPHNTKPQALRILGTVLDFNLEERGRAGLEPGSGSGGWLHSLLHPGTGTASGQSLSEAFIRFLESESRPQPQLRLLPTLQEQKEQQHHNNTGVSESPVPSGRSPILLTEVQLPTFTQFPVPRSSSSILKDVLKDS